MRSSLAVLLPVLLCCGCGGDAVEPSDRLGPDTTAQASVRFDDYFAELAIEDSATHQRGLYNELAGYRFSRKARLQVAYVARRPSVLGIAVLKRGTGEVAGVRSQAIASGSGTVPLGSFPRDYYILQAFVSEVRIAEIRFASE